MAGIVPGLIKKVIKKEGKELLSDTGKMMVKKAVPIKHELSSLKDKYLGDKVRFKKDGTVEVKQSFFYRHGGSAEKLAATIKAKAEKHGVGIKILKAEEHYNGWPKDSWWEVHFKKAE